MKRLLLAMTFMLAPASALADTITNSIGNTVVVQTADGARIELRPTADGAYTRRLPNGAIIHGRWTRDGANFCETPEGGAQVCHAVAADKNVGDTWTESDDNGASVTISIVAGQ